MNADQRLLLDNQLCFALYSASLAMTQLYKPHLEKLGLTYPQYTILLILWEQDARSLKDIANQLGQKSGSLTPVIKRMEADGLVQRKRGVENDRTLSIELTSKGEALKQQALMVNQCVFEACGTDVAELTELKNKLVSLKNQISK
ncbi:MarR family winged helix-turn-helix transcriptional regulator [Neptunicella marina]|uniref:MarR family transcriptional regulator n=1 Tax=Neptunicella marina TaxID=2125989 RepID=A0A8J6IWL8_9ALTE|nr:MarR family transcriptional regulator [Neptunicella marina]MBC3766841.1 MarR family transcriptional regulator [Neptunicella marina]